MSEYFYTPALPSDGPAEIALPMEEANHAATVLRVSEGDRLHIIDGHGQRGQGTVAAVSKGRRSEVLVTIDSVTSLPPCSPAVHLFVGVTKHKQMNLIIRQATELGVNVIHPILTDYTIAKPTKQNKIEHWQKEAIAAMKQSGNPFIPRIQAPVGFHTALTNWNGPGFFGGIPEDESSSLSPTQHVTPAELSLWIGPEGGFSEEENNALKENRLVPICVGQWILRVETAVVALLAVLMSQCQNNASRIANDYVNP
jgi:16S rRNA (uracil1498-N3)-methyltransferase